MSFYIGMIFWRWTLGILIGRSSRYQRRFIREPQGVHGFAIIVAGVIVGVLKA